MTLSLRRLSAFALEDVPQRRQAAKNAKLRKVHKPLADFCIKEKAF